MMQPSLPSLGTPLPSSREMAEWDYAAITAGTSSLTLMERAGCGIVEVIRRGGLLNRERETLILAGPGNNGGDGLVVARLLVEAGFRCAVVIAAAERFSPDFLANGARSAELGIPLFVFGEKVVNLPFCVTPLDAVSLRQKIAGATLIIDALLGTGQRAAPAGAVKLLIEAMEGRSSNSLIVSIDIPSGVDGDSGVVYTPAIRAELTVTIQYIKRGLTQFPARARCGRIEVVDIGVAPGAASEFSLLGDSCAELPIRRGDSHKGDFGHVLVIGGSAAMPGAPVLSARGALRLGAGWVSLARPVNESVEPELMRVPLVSDIAGDFQAHHLAGVVAALGRADAVVLGPGLGQGVGVQRFFKPLLGELVTRKIPTVLDADALNLLSEDRESLKMLGGRAVIVTPHPGEAGRLLERDSAMIQCDRFGAARELSNELGCVVVLKGAGTIVYGDSHGFVCPFGTPYLAIPGSGDVLSGFIGALIAQGASSIEAGCRGVVIHALAGENAHRARGGFLLASDVITAVGKTVRFR